MKKTILYTLLILISVISIAYAATNPLTVTTASQGAPNANNVLHPDVMYLNPAQDGKNWWMTHTPYPVEAVEHPWIVRSDDGINWSDTTGITNPVLDTPTDYGFTFDADVDFLYLSDYDKWFMVWSPRFSNSPKEHGLAFAYSSDGKSWTYYDGATVNGLTLPIIMSGSSSCSGGHGDDSGSAAWERNGSGCGQIQYPAMVYKDGTFYLWYGETVSGNNEGQVGCATFTWNNSTNDIENFTRCAGNPVMDYTDFPTTASWHQGLGHMDVVWDAYNGNWEMVALRQPESAQTVAELHRFTATNHEGPWTAQDEPLIARGDDANFDDHWIYRTGILHNGEGWMMKMNDTTVYYESAYDDSNTTRIGIKDAATFSNNPTPFGAGVVTSGSLTFTGINIQ